MSLSCPAEAVAPGLCRATVWAYAFRPFFLLSCGYGVLLTTVWAGFMASGMATPGAMPTGQWHAHEMLVGFIGAALAGFLLTAVPSWTNSAPVVRGRLVLLVAVWAAGRLAMWGAGWLPTWIVGGINLAFLPLVLAWVAPPILRDPTGRHRAFPLVLGMLYAAHVLCHWGWLAGEAAFAKRGLDAMISMFVLLIVLTVSRITMVVINAALDERGETRRFRPNPARNTLAWTTVALYAAAEFVAPQSAVTGWVAMAAAAAQLDRLTDWHVGRAVLKPYVLILYAAYWWIAIGLALIGLHHVFGAVPESAGRHALAIGAVGSAILAVFVIAGMRHTGHALEVPRLGALAFVLMNAAATLRVAVPCLMPEWYGTLGLGVSSTLMAGALLAYLICFTPKLLRPRVDGKEG